MIKLCKDCAHCAIDPWGAGTCARPDPLTGFPGVMDLRRQRLGCGWFGKCGKAARYFVSKPVEIETTTVAGMYTVCPAQSDLLHKKIQQWCRRVEGFDECRFWPIKSTCWARLEEDLKEEK